MSRHEATDLVLELTPLPYHVAGYTDALAHSFLKLLDNLVKTLASCFKTRVSTCVHMKLQATEGLAHLRQEDSLLRHPAKLRNQSQLFQTLDRPFCGVEVPWLHTITVIPLKRVVVIVVALAKGKERHDPGV